MKFPKNVFKITLSISLMGILLLLIISNQQPKLTTINQITIKDLNKNIKIQGEITNIKNYQESNFQILSIKDETGEIDITANQILNLTNSQTIIVSGKVTEYENNLQIQASKIFIS